MQHQQISLPHPDHEDSSNALGLAGMLQLWGQRLGTQDLCNDAETLSQIAMDTDDNAYDDDNDNDDDNAG